MLSEGHNRNYVKFKKCYGRGCQNYSRCLVTRIELFPSFRKRNPNTSAKKRPSDTRMPRGEYGQQKHYLPWVK